ncbi:MULTISPECIES: glycosyltransferase [Amycolatopsis]|uniref:glycosyltransferase n=1 Tax=Amycolatopsis sp. cg13 TaxID=3238807 RepID=UPI0035265E63
MRILFVTWSAPGHFNPMVPLARACLAVGHEVRVAGPPSCRNPIVSAGLPAVVCGEDVDLSAIPTDGRLRAWDEPESWPMGWPQRPGLLGPAQTDALDCAADRQVVVAEAMLPQLIAFGRWWGADLVVADPLTFAGPVAAAALGVPLVSHGWEIGTVLHAERAGRGVHYREGYAQLFRSRGLEPQPASRVLVDPCPPSLVAGGEGVVRRVPIRHQSYTGSGAVPSWLVEPRERRRICLTGGIATGKIDGGQAKRVLADLIELTGDLDAEILLAGEQGTTAEPLPPRVREIGLVPFSLLLPSCDAVVHHGGTGTALCAVAAGVPQVVVPRSPIYGEVGHQIAAAGAGRVLPAGAERAALTSAIEEVLTDSRYPKALAGLRREIEDAPTPAAVAERLPEVAEAAAGARVGEPV